ncbi:hypothetical protein, partial [Clostridioides difficile]|uniref:hypothetical protein n=1 Tax=Clostridioides difficile TaxID=1496 RepID=UPI001A9A4C70
VKIYAEELKSNLDKLSSYARQWLDHMEQPHVVYIIGLSQAISIEPKNTSENPRAPVVPMTKIYDYLRLLLSLIHI